MFLLLSCTVLSAQKKCPWPECRHCTCGKAAASAKTEKAEEPKGPQGKLLYCSYSATGAAGLGKDYCELVADEGKKPVIHVRLNVGNRFGEKEPQGDFTVSEEVVETLRRKLAEAEVYKLNGYSVEECITGGTTYRIYMEYASGEKINAHWYGHDVKDEARAAYYLIARYFEPWRAKTQ